jgi:hypothetical protein
VSRFARASWSQYKNIVVGEDLGRGLTDLIERLDGLRSGLRGANLIKGVGHIGSRLWSSHLIKRVDWVVNGRWDIAIGYVVVFYHTSLVSLFTTWIDSRSTRTRLPCLPTTRHIGHSL